MLPDIHVFIPTRRGFEKEGRILASELMSLQTYRKLQVYVVGDPYEGDDELTNTFEVLDPANAVQFLVGRIETPYARIVVAQPYQVFHPDAIAFMVAMSDARGCYFADKSFIMDVSNGTLVKAYFDLSVRSPLMMLPVHILASLRPSIWKSEDFADIYNRVYRGLYQTVSAPSPISCDSVKIVELVGFPKTNPVLQSISDLKPLRTVNETLLLEQSALTNVLMQRKIRVTFTNITNQPNETA